MDEFCKAVSQVYTTTPDRERGLRDVVANAALSRYHRFVSFDAFLDLLADVPEFNRDVAKDLGRMLGQKVVEVCAICGARLERSRCRCHVYSRRNVASADEADSWASPTWRNSRSSAGSLLSVNDNDINAGWGH